MVTGLTTGQGFAPRTSTGAVPGPGTYFCTRCGSHLALRENDMLPLCPACGATEFRLDSIFESLQEQVHAGASTARGVDASTASPGWLRESRRHAATGTRHLLHRPGADEVIDFPIAEGWTRIGRSAAADIQLDDPSVSRRHALLVSEPGRAVRVLDDRSINGVLINDEPVEWGKLGDGDVLTIGSFRLFMIEP